MNEELYKDDQTVSALILNATERSMAYNISKKNGGGNGEGSDDDPGPEGSMIISTPGNNGQKRKQKDQHDLC